MTAQAPDSSGSVPLSGLAPEEKARRAGSFGAVASHYERYRPGPPSAAVKWLLPDRVARAVDLGAGTGALTRLLTERADEVVAVEPDPRMRQVLAERVPTAKALEGRGEDIPLPNGSADAVLASSSWHWMEPGATLAEVHRVLVPGGVLGVIWSGPDAEGPFLSQAKELLRSSLGDGSRLSGFLGDAERPASTLEIPPEAGFDERERRLFSWTAGLTAEDLIGLLGTYSWTINLDPPKRTRLFDEARRLLRDVAGLTGSATVEVSFRADVWRARRLA